MATLAKSVVVSDKKKDCYVTHVRLSRDGSAAAVADTSSTITVYSLPKLKQVGVCMGRHKAAIRDLSFINADKIVSCDASGVVVVWDAAEQWKGRTLPQFRASPPECLFAVAVHPEGPLIALPEKYSVQVLEFTDSDFTSYKKKKLEDFHTDDVTCLQFHPTDRSLLCSGSEDCLVNVYRWQQEDENDILEWVFNAGQPVQRVGFLGPSGQLCGAITSTDTFLLWSISDGDELMRIPRDAEWRYLINFCQATVDPANDPCLIVSGARETDEGTPAVGLSLQVVKKFKLVEISELAGGHAKGTIVRDAAVSPDGKKLLTAAEDGKLCVWDLDVSARPLPLQKKAQKETVAEETAEEAPPKKKRRKDAEAEAE
eukprot:TRINITY_DN56310_c0_g1_i1.p1 TRINITY_DN56310_c0_g1~~TRINITY_DN56310_c0_g1_i1.p1  ORF type:complete len:380 (+),score=83.26 TRINITY_DN56310_c0_g1_i1:29-1141(+)